MMQHCGFALTGWRPAVVLVILSATKDLSTTAAPPLRMRGLAQDDERARSAMHHL